MNWEQRGTDAVCSGSRTTKTVTQRGHGIGVELQRNNYEETGVLREKERIDGGREEKRRERDTDTDKTVDRWAV